MDKKVLIPNAKTILGNSINQQNILGDPTALMEQNVLSLILI